MICNRLELCRLELVPQEAGIPQWRRELIGSQADRERILEGIPGEMANYGYSQTECFRLRLALEEALVNAHKHGHQEDWSKSVTLRYCVSARGVVAQVEDQGRGFNPERVPDPLAPENIERPSGRGLFLMRSFLSGVCHNEQGNCICLCQHRSPLQRRE
jgi:serine/threonine-protein kinase RsbW